MMGEDGDDFGPLYSDIFKPCSTAKEPNFFNDQKPFNFHATSDLSANAFKDLEEYDKFLLSECGVDGGKLLPECKVDDEFDDVIFDVEMEQKEAEIDGRGLDGDNEINVLVDMMDVENDDLELECLRSSTRNDSVDEEESESDESFDIIIDDDGLNDHNVGSDKKDAEIKELGLLKVGSFNYLDNYDDLEPGEIPGMKAELGTDVEARVGQSNQSFHTESKGVRSVFVSQTIDDSKAKQNQVNPVRNAEYNYGSTNPVCNAEYNYGGTRFHNYGSTRFRYLPAHFRQAFNLEDNYLGYKPWKRPGVNLSDYFNFDLDEENWQNYCKQMKQLLQTSPPSKAVGNRSERVQSNNTPAKQIREAIQVLISHGERVACLQNHHRRECDSDEIIEIVFVDSPDDTESFTKDLKDRALHGYQKRPTTIHKIVSGDKILPFPLDGSFYQIYHEERLSYAQEGSQWTDFESMVSKKQDYYSYQDWSMDLDHTKEKSEAKQGPRGALVKYDKVVPLYSNKDVRKHNEGQTTVRNRLEDDRFHNSGEKSWRKGDSSYKKSLKQPDESKTTATVYDNQDTMGNGFENCRMRMEGTFFQTDHQDRNDDNKLNKGSAVDEGHCRKRIDDTLYQTDHQEGNNDSKLNKGSAVDEDNCKMRIEETVLYQTDHRKGNNDNKLNKGSAVNEDNCNMRADETLSKTDHQEGNNDNKLNKGSAVNKDNCKMRIEETVYQTDQQKGNNDNKLNKGSAVNEDNCRMRIDETFSETDHQERNNDNKMNKGSAIDEDNCRMRIDDCLPVIEHQEANNDNKLNEGSAVNEDNCRMRIDETFSEKDHQERNNDNKLNKGSAIDEDNCRMRIEECLPLTEHQEENTDNKVNKGSAIDEDNCKMRIVETLCETDHQEGDNDNNCNKGSTVDEGNCRIRTEETFPETDHQEGNNDNKLSNIDKETLSETDHQEGNNDNKLNNERAVEEDFNGEQLTEPIDNYEQEFPDNCNLVTNLGNDVIFDDQKHEAEREENVDEVQGSPRANESCRDGMKQLMSNIKGFISEVDELVYSQKHEHRICCLR